MFIILADDEKYNQLQGAVKALFTDEFISSYVFIYDTLLDAVEKMEGEPHIDIGLFDLDFKPESGVARIGENKRGGYRDDETQLMGINCLYIGVSKSKQFVGTLYTFYSKEILQRKSLDLRVFVDYILPQLESEEKIVLLSEARGSFESIAAEHIRKMLKIARRKFSPQIDGYVKFSNVVNALRQEYEDVSKADLISKIRRVKESFKFNEGLRKFTFETFFPDQEKIIQELLEVANSDDKIFGPNHREKLLGMLNSLIIDWRPYISVLSHLLDPAGAYDKHCHGRELTAQDKSLIKRVKEFEMLPREVIQDLENGNCKEYRASEFLGVIERNLENKTQLSLEDKRGKRHEISLSLPSSLDLNVRSLGLPCKFFYEVLLGEEIGSLLRAEIVNHGFGENPEGCHEVIEKNVTIGFQRIRRTASELDDQEVEEYVLSLADNGYGFSGIGFSTKRKGNLQAIVERVRDWCEEFFIETHYCKDRNRFKWDLFKEEVVKEFSPTPIIQDSFGTVYSFIFRRRRVVI